MTNHVHLLLTPTKASSLPRTMQSLGRRYVRYINFGPWATTASKKQIAKASGA